MAVDMPNWRQILVHLMDAQHSVDRYAIISEFH